ncbi:MAG: helix-turn-helix transcriptional regulator, partial [bacterium]
MDRTLNLTLLRDVLIRNGLNQAALAAKLNISREAVSNWFKGEAFPTPDKLLRLGMIVGLKYNDLVKTTPPKDVPIVTYRRKAGRKTKDAHLDNARETGELLKKLVKHLPVQELTQPPILKSPCNKYAYIQKVAAGLRREMDLESKTVIDFKDLIDKFNKLHAVIVPVLWGARERHGNALNIYLPDSKILWVFLNLDSNAIDFKFWMAHELGHALAPNMNGKEGEDFADAFAQALLFPEPDAANLRTVLQGLPGIGARIEQIRNEARRHIISPYTIRLALEAYEKANNLPATQLGAVTSFMGSVKNFSKDYESVAAAIFGKSAPKPDEYIAVAGDVFKSTFFKALSHFCKEEQGVDNFIIQVLGLPLAD